MPDITISVVSHGQIQLVGALLHDLATHCRESNLEVILTINVPEELPASFDQFPYPLLILRNINPLGFGENHNRAFQHANYSFFCVVNPDIRIDSDVFHELTRSLGNRAIGVVAPLVVNGVGEIEDSARKFPTPLKILRRIFSRYRVRDYHISADPLDADWVGGMFMVFRRETYESLRGFDRRYFLYYEDVDLCARIHLAGLRVVMIPQVRVIHLARRASHSNMNYFQIHINSMLRFFTSMVFIRVVLRRAK